MRTGLRSVAFALLALTLPFFAHAEAVSSVRVAIELRADGSAIVGESIAYDFGDTPHHGIFRDIQLQYKDELGGTESIDVSDISVTDDKNVPQHFETSESGGYEHIKIGDPDTTITGTHAYVISYTVRGVVGYFADHDELYWNATGDQWQVPIESAQVVVWTPVPSTSHACYEGPRSSTQSCDSNVRLDGTGRPIALFTSGVLAPGSGLTIAVGLPKGVIAEPTRAQKIWQLIEHNLPLALPPGVLVVLALMWWKYGKDARGRGTIIPEYDAPDGLSLVDAAEIVNQRISAKDLSALLIELAVRGYLTIERIESKTLGIFESIDYRFRRAKPADDSMTEEEQTLYEKIFSGTSESVLASELKKTRALINALSSVKKSVENRMVSEGYYRARPGTVRNAYILAAIALAIVAFFALGAFLTPAAVIGIGISAVLIAIFAFIMPAKTKKGALAYESILGLKEYLQIAEKNRLDFHNAPEKSPALFEKLLPYAMMLGVSTAWAKEFEGIYKEPPRWYTGGAYPIFTPTAFADDLSSFATAAAALAAPTSGSGGAGGGGFSGGGFGGGGGGSW